jgi:hypothetical protein
MLLSRRTLGDEHVDVSSSGGYVHAMTDLSYIGVSGVTTRGEADALLATLPVDAPRPLMLGVLTSSKLLCDIGNPNPKRYPKKREIAGIFTDHPRALNLVHVAWSQDEALGTCVEQFVRAREAGGDRCHGLQVNGLNAPTPSDLRAHAQRYPNDRLVLQWRDLTRQCEHLILRLQPYAWSITDVLLDGSAGEGRPMDVAKMTSLATALRDFYPHLGITVAGGFGPTITADQATMLWTVDRLSTDVESGVRTDDILDLALAGAHVRGVLAALTPKAGA